MPSERQRHLTKSERAKVTDVWRSAWDDVQALHEKSAVARISINDLKKLLPDTVENGLLISILTEQQNALVGAIVSTKECLGVIDLLLYPENLKKEPVDAEEALIDAIAESYI